MREIEMKAKIMKPRGRKTVATHGMPKKKGMPHIGGAMGKKKGVPKGTRAHTFTASLSKDK
jgi:hypothetical protein